MIRGNLNLPKMNGLEVSPGIFLIGEPSPVEGSTSLRCLADVNGALALVELKLRFGPVSAGKQPANTSPVSEAK